MLPDMDISRAWPNTYPTSVANTSVKFCAMSKASRKPTKGHHEHDKPTKGHHERLVTLKLITRTLTVPYERNIIHHLVIILCLRDFSVPKIQDMLCISIIYKA